MEPRSVETVLSEKDAIFTFIICYRCFNGFKYRTHILTDTVVVVKILILTLNIIEALTRSRKLVEGNIICPLKHYLSFDR